MFYSSTHTADGGQSVSATLVAAVGLRQGCCGQVFNCNRFLIRSRTGSEATLRVTINGVGEPVLSKSDQVLESWERV